MRLVLDTHALLWWRNGDRHLSRSAAQLIESAIWLGVPDLVLLEFCDLVQRGRISLKRTPGEWLRDALNEPRIEVVPISVEIAVAAASLKAAYSLDPVDAIVAATALRLGLTLITADERLRALPIIDSAW